MIKPYIKNETAVDIICSICDRMYPGMDCEPADCEWMKMLTEESVDAAPVVHGRWEYIPQTLNTLSQFRCPFCRWWSLDPSIDGAYNYCPNCGAKMDEKEATYD